MKSGVQRSIDSINFAHCQLTGSAIYILIVSPNHTLCSIVMDTTLYYRRWWSRYSHHIILVWLQSSQCLGPACSSRDTRAATRWTSLPYVTGYEKRDHFTQNAFVCHFSNCHHSKVSRALGFWLGLLAVCAFYFTDPTLVATASLLSQAVSRQREA